MAGQLQELGAEFRRGHKSYQAKLKGQTIEEYRPDLSLNKPAASQGASSFFEDDAPECVDPVRLSPAPLPATMAAAAVFDGVGDVLVLGWPRLPHPLRPTPPSPPALARAASRTVGVACPTLARPPLPRAALLRAADAAAGHDGPDVGGAREADQPGGREVPARGSNGGRRPRLGVPPLPALPPDPPARLPPPARGSRMAASTTSRTSSRRSRCSSSTRGPSSIG